MAPEHRMRSRRSTPGCEQAPGMAARASCSSRAKAASGDWAARVGKEAAASNPAATARAPAKLRISTSIEQVAAVSSAGAPTRQPAGERLGLHRKVRQIGGDQVEAATGDGQPQVAAVELCAVVPELAKQLRSQHDRIILDIDATQRGSP